MSVTLSVGDDYDNGLNFSNSNFVFLFSRFKTEIKGFHQSELVGTITVDEAKQLFEEILLIRITETCHFIRPTVQSENWIDCGIGVDYLESKFTSLLILLGTAVVRNTDINFG